MTDFVGNIPQELYYLIVPIKEIVKTVQHYTGDVISEYQGYRAYVCAKGSSSFKTLQKRAEYDICRYKAQNNINEVITPVIHLISNLKLGSLQIISDVFEKSSNFVCNVLLPKENFPKELNITEDIIVNMTSNTLREVLFNTKVDEGEITDSKFIWAVANSQPQLVRVGSKFHKKLEIKESENVYKKIPKEFLKPFSVYSDKQNNEFVYLGNVYYYVPEQVSRVAKNVTVNYRRQDYYDYTIKYVIKQSPVWLPFKSYDKNKPKEQQLQEHLTSYSYYIFDIKDKAVYKETCSFIPIALKDICISIYSKDLDYFNKSFYRYSKNISLSETPNIDISHLSADLQKKITNGEIVTAYGNLGF